MKLWVLRHGEAQQYAGSDAARALTDTGRAQVSHCAVQLLGKPLDAVLASPYVRAQQTAQLVHGALGLTDPVITVPWLTPDSLPDQVMLELERRQLEHVLLVSHQPLVGTLIGALCGHDHPMGTASLAELEGEWPLSGLMTLKSLRHA